ncbi:hypothetical protein [Herbiconiux sp. VKM Ac-2851]|uniref:hypothetical protein n=1 Tax=Herbiconiux sp. VKM Ac-2851 TaxID=2739025 RepID=UPI0015642339|nr:hypothetical protein [Herbiconiux sp. VKM Ac-2851]NQX34347.1 hypothetical protein [Herbiconiux sp. VKM Ac-2851]
MNSIVKRTVSMSLGTLGLTAVLVGASGLAAHAEMTDPPAQANVDWIPEGPVGFNNIGGVPSDMVGAWQMIGMWDGTFHYSPVNPTSVATGGALNRLSEYKDGGCAITSPRVITCDY